MPPPASLLPRFEVKRTVDQTLCDRTIDFVLAKIDANLRAFQDAFPGPCSRNGVYPLGPNEDWTSSFWTGQLWLAYELTGRERYREAARRHLEDFRRRLDARIGTDTHDLGFLYILSCVAGYKLLGDARARETALQAANLLMERHLPAAGIIQAWGDLRDERERGRMIIDCGMNLPLLYWASEQTGDARYRWAARRHAEASADFLVRDDGSTFHTFYMDPISGAARGGKTQQGFSDQSCWSRGQAWGVYGFTLSFLHTGDRRFLEQALRLADYFLERLPEDAVAYWDLHFTSGPEERDSSAAAIMACGLLELSRQLPLASPTRNRLENAALDMVHSLARSYTSSEVSACNGLLLHAVYDKNAGKGVDECCLWGDYFFVEALVRVTRSWRPYWSGL